jgi:serine/threonine protein kinase
MWCWQRKLLFQGKYASVYLKGSKVVKVSSNSIRAYRCLHNEIKILKELQQQETSCAKFVKLESAGFNHYYMEFLPHCVFDLVNASNFTIISQRNIVVQLFSALDFLHKRHLAHRDVKLENIMVSEKNRVKLIDFGFAIQLDSDTMVTGIVGTLKYIAPEVYTEDKYCAHKADCWAALICTFSIYFGFLPFYTASNDDAYFYKMTKKLPFDDGAGLNITNNIEEEEEFLFLCWNTMCNVYNLREFRYPQSVMHFFVTFFIVDHRIRKNCSYIYYDLCQHCSTYL